MGSHLLEGVLISHQVQIFRVQTPNFPGPRPPRDGGCHVLRRARISVPKACVVGAAESVPVGVDDGSPIHPAGPVSCPLPCCVCVCCICCICCTMHSNLPHLPITRFSASCQPPEMSSFGETFSASVPLFRLEGVRPREMTTTSPNANSTLPVLPSCQPLGTPACHHQSELDEASAAPTAAKLRPCRSCPFLHAAGNSQSPLRVSVGSQSRLDTQCKGSKNC